MNKRLVWNFEINSDNPVHISGSESFVQSPNRWESRFFWPEAQIITLNGLKDSFLALSTYQIKHRLDTYFLIPNTDYNLKMRCEQLIYKPIVMKKDHAIAYGKKINLMEHPPDLKLPGCAEKDAAMLVARIKRQGIKINVEKDALIYTFETTPTTKLELARLHVSNKSYLSACIESRSLLLLESMTRHILGDFPACDYVTFLKRSSK